MRRPPAASARQARSRAVSGLSCASRAASACRAPTATRPPSIPLLVPPYPFVARCSDRLTQAGVYGWLGLLNKVGAEAFSDEDERLAGILAAQVGRIYERTAASTRTCGTMRRRTGVGGCRAQARGGSAPRERGAIAAWLLNSTAEGHLRDRPGKAAAPSVTRPGLRLLGYAEPSQVLGKDMHVLMHHSRADGAPYPQEGVPDLPGFSARLKALTSRDEVAWRADGSQLSPPNTGPVRFAAGGQGRGLGSNVLGHHRAQATGDQFSPGAAAPPARGASSPARALHAVAIAPDQIRGSADQRQPASGFLDHPPEAALNPDWWPGNVPPGGSGLAVIALIPGGPARPRTPRLNGIPVPAPRRQLPLDSIRAADAPRWDWPSRGGRRLVVGHNPNASCSKTSSARPRRWRRSAGWPAGGPRLQQTC